MKVEVILRLLNSLRAHIEAVRPLQDEPFATLTQDVVRWNGLLHLLQLCVEHTVDIGNHILAGKQRAISDDSRETIRALGYAGVIPLEFAQRIAPMTGFRNVVVHEYLTIDPLIVQKVLEHGLGDLEQFAAYIYDYMRREGHLPDETSA